ncbi:type II toxin-antitoxin system VapC family toxin [Sphingomonas bacterium]|uniref:type II toxin-antitoxin system VapC family toxin n=1 Tax=Sphingomonas bacterium TaxID=1895847 RepID=UPI00157688F4|nr:type II toxin-antitoxin system VapC family toxin [Sphingomonas bacterium]
MILVDTNVWSEAFRSLPDPSVRGWARDHSDQLWLSTVVVGELLSGVELMPIGRKRLTLAEGYSALIEQYRDRVLPFDLDAARVYATVLASQERAGRNPGTADTQIAATALSRGLALATRNTKHFAGLGLQLINPWLNELPAPPTY